MKPRLGEENELLVNLFPLLLFLFIVPVFDRGRYGIYSRTPFDDDDDDDDDD